ncbi:hypothetical protein FHU38_004636 [Saccharomonospora amisosensis]|uniref:DUF4234 domain-containing protein n=1 Tax=Saccharomonospora amisosensis TaxID=1128677 RepID=A0A7X5ZSV0_9PSEU|nr:DUF4234 domain-containing protein [Saccharomonospora amisosensis]NIJ14292.1 hypothetical protein [Saccharomonospora amisosensis]
MTHSEHEAEHSAQHFPSDPSPPQDKFDHADLIQSAVRIDRAIKQRRDTDVQLVNWWLYFLLLSWITLGIYSIYLFFVRISRIDNFSQRKHAYYSALLEWTGREAAARNRQDIARQELADLGQHVSLAYQRELRPIKAGLSFVLTLLTVGIYYFFVLYRLNRYWWDAQLVEQDFDDKLSQVWTKLGIINYPLNFEVDQHKRRSYPLYLILSLLTGGIWGAVWDYQIHTDPDNLFNEYHQVEDSVLQTVRSH